MVLLTVPPRNRSTIRSDRYIRVNVKKPPEDRGRYRCFFGGVFGCTARQSGGACGLYDHFCCHCTPRFVSENTWNFEILLCRIRLSLELGKASSRRVRRHRHHPLERVYRGDMNVCRGSGSVAKSARGRHARCGVRQRQPASPDCDTRAATCVALSVQRPRVFRSVFVRLFVLLFLIVFFVCTSIHFGCSSPMHHTSHVFRTRSTIEVAHFG